MVPSRCFNWPKPTRPCAGSSSAKVVKSGVLMSAHSDSAVAGQRALGPTQRRSVTASGDHESVVAASAAVARRKIVMAA